MADLEDFRCSVAKATPTADQSTFQYQIKMQYGPKLWEVQKRFSDFDALLQALSGGKYAGLPRLPAKTLLGAPMDEAAVAERKEQLRIIIHDLLNRADTRTSHRVREFLDLDAHMPEPSRALHFEAVRTFEDARFGVSGLALAPQSNLLLVTHEDSTHLARLGRVWSVVEPDELGALHLWAQVGDSGWKRLYSQTFVIKVRSLVWEEVNKQFFVGLEDGKILVFKVDEDTLAPTKKASLELHHKSPVTFLGASPRRLLSLGFDTAMRVVDAVSHELLCGGRLMKRLRSEADYLTCGLLDDARDRALIGTSCGDVIILDISRNPPSFLHTVEVGTTSISMMCSLRDSLLVANGDALTSLTFEGQGSERRTAKLGNYRAKHLQEDEAALLSVCAAPSRGLIFGGYSDGSVAVWRTSEAEAVLVFSAHDCDVTQVVWQEHAPWGPALFTGGGDGKVTTWTLSGRFEDFVLWKPQGVATIEDIVGPAPRVIGAAQSLGSPYPANDDFPSLMASPEHDPFAPSFATGGSAFAAGACDSDVFGSVAQPRINPKAFKTAEDSDSGDDLAAALR